MFWAMRRTIVLSMLCLAGCGTAPVEGPSLAHVHRDVAAYIGETVSWLGTVRRATAKEGGTEVVVEGHGAPVSGEEGALPPLFIAEVPGRIQRELRRGENVTVTGTVSGVRDGGLPVVEAKVIRRGLGGGNRVWPPAGRLGRSQTLDQYY
jgi:starvation-inducible outer membrane lipoprotein